MNDQVTLSKYVWVAMAVVFLLVLGGVWIASAPGQRPRDEAQAATTDPPSYQAFDRNYAATVPAQPPLPPAPVIGSGAPLVNAAPANTPSVVVTPVTPQAAKSKAASVMKPKAAQTTPRDMFPVGDITRDLPQVDHPYRQIAELYPAFQYKDRLWMATGRYVLSAQASLVPLGMKLATGQALFALADASASDRVLFVQSKIDPNKFAVYRAS